MKRTNAVGYPLSICIALCAAVAAASMSCVTNATSSQAAGEALPGISGDWMGSLDIGVSLRIVFRIHTDPDSPGGYAGVCMSPDQSTAEFPISAITFDGNYLSIAVASIGARYEGSYKADDSIEGHFYQGPAKLPLTLKRVEWKSPVQPQEPVGPFPYRDEEVRVPAEGFTLAGTLSVPDDKRLANAQGRLPAVIVITGSGLQNRDEEILGHKPFLLIADHLARSGFAVLRLDDRGFGASGGDPSGATTEDFAKDISAALDYLKARPELDGARIGLCGHSEGGLIAFMLAAKRPDDVAFIVSLAGPGMNGAELLELQARLIAKAEGVPDTIVERNADLQKKLLALATRSDADDQTIAGEARDLLSGEGLSEAEIDATVAEISSPWMRWFVSCDPADYLLRIRCPVLAMNGELDLQVPYEQNLGIIREILAKAGNDRSVILSFPGLNHLFQHAKSGSPSEYGLLEETFAPEVLDAMAEWLIHTVSP